MTFCERYSEIQTTEVKALQVHLRSDEVLSAYNRKMHAAFDGELPHALDMVISLTKALLTEK